MKKPPRRAPKALAPPAAYRRLLRACGPQGWWPVTPTGGRGPRYRPGFRGRLTERQRLEVCVGAILTQNTNWSNVEKALARLRSAGIRDLADFLPLPRRRLERLIKPSGFYRQKARKVMTFVQHLDRRGGKVGRWLSGDLARRREELLGLYGIGPETADSMLLYAAGRPAFVVDAYTLRIGRRLGWFRAAGTERAQAFLARGLPRSAAVYGEFHALLVALAKRHCRKTPACPGCPLEGACCHGRAG